MVDAILADILATCDPWAADLLISALAAAAGSYRRATATAPFPSALFEQRGGAEGQARDYGGLLENLQALPPAAQLAQPAAAARLSEQQRGLLRWLLLHPRRPVTGLHRCTLRQVQEQLPSLTGWVADIGMNPSLRPAAVLQLSAVPPGVGASRVLAFHGTSMENMHSILHHGLLNASGTRLERTGAAFGKGIYFSSELAVAFAFCQPADGWAGSALGRRLRALLVCSLDRDHIQGSHNSDLVPDKYLVVERMDAVALHFVFVYSDDAAVAAAQGVAGAAQQAAQQQAAAAAAAHQRHAAAAMQPPAQQPHGSLLLWLLAGFCLLLLLINLQDNWPKVRRVLRRTLGLPLY